MKKIYIFWLDFTEASLKIKIGRTDISMSKDFWDNQGSFLSETEK